LNAFFLWLEATALSTWVRESTSVFAFPSILSVHAVGMALAVGVNAAIALRLLGVAAAVPARELRRFTAVMWIGFWLNTASGMLLLIGYPTKALTNPVFYMKLAAITLGMWLYVVMTKRLQATGTAVRLDDPGGGVDRTTRLLGAASLTCWAGAITAGRLLAYTADRILATWQ
jgi:hypothetical protein